MFHLMIVLFTPWGIMLWLGPLLQVAVASRKWKYAKWIPAVVGIVITSCIYCFGEIRDLSILFLLLYWGFYGLLLLITYRIVDNYQYREKQRKKKD